MAKNEKVTPADIVKAKLEAEKSELDIATDQPNAVDVDEADLDAADEVEAGSGTTKQLIDLSEDPVSEDPELVAKRKAAFARAEAFERKLEEDRQRKINRLAGVVQPAPHPVVAIGDHEIPEVFYKYATAIPSTTPDEHVLCGYGSIKLRVGDFRRLVGLPSRV